MRSQNLSRFTAMTTTDCRTLRQFTAWLTIVVLSASVRLSNGYKQSGNPGGSLTLIEGDPQLPTIRTGYTCEGEELLVQCGPQEVIQIIRANFGRFSIAICNEEGRTHWSVNCMSIQTRPILQNKCDGRNSCRVPVNSDLFGDPCPGTHKYVEIHYTCTSNGDQLSYSQQQQAAAHWFLQNTNSTGGRSNDPWLLANNKGSDLGNQPQLSMAGGSSSSSSSGGSNNNKPFRPRIPILVATTTSVPKRIPITSRATTPMTSTVTSSTAAVTDVTTQTSEDSNGLSDDGKDGKGLNQKRGSDKSQDRSLSDSASSSVNKGQNRVVEEVGEDSEFCGAVLSRNLYWERTKRGKKVVQPCPNGATGRASWTCVKEKTESHWATPQPDMSDCKSAAMTNLEVKVRQKDPENVIASSLAHLTGSRRLYGGDLESAVGVMATVANSIQFLLHNKKAADGDLGDEDESGSNRFYKKEAYIQEVLLNIVRSGSNLLDVKNQEAWADLPPLQQTKIASDLMVALEANAFLFADVTDQPEILMESSYNILMAISVMSLKNSRDGVNFPLHNYEEPYGTIDDLIHLPPAALRSAATKGGTVAKAIFFSFKHLDEILSRYFLTRPADLHHTAHLLHQPTTETNGLRTDNDGADSDEKRRHRLVINSRILSALLVGQGGGLARPPVRLSEPVRVHLSHLRPAEEDGLLSEPQCVHWDVEQAGWSDAGCRVVETTRDWTDCECGHLTSFALLMTDRSASAAGGASAGHLGGNADRDGVVTTVVHLPDFHVEIIIASVAGCCLIIMLVLALRFRSQLRRLLRKLPCNCEEKKGGLDTCSKSQSFFTGMNLVQGAGSGPAGNRTLVHGGAGATSVRTATPDKNHTMSTTLPDAARLSQYLSTAGLPPLPPGLQYDLSGATNTSTLPLRAALPLPPSTSITLVPASNISSASSGAGSGSLSSGTSAHITLNPYSTSLVDNIDRMLMLQRTSAAGGDVGILNHIYQMAGANTNPNVVEAMPVAGGHESPGMHSLMGGVSATTLKKKKCLAGGHNGPCHNNGQGQGCGDQAAPGVAIGDNRAVSDVVFRAVSPHGHVYWEIDPKRPDKMSTFANTMDGQSSENNRLLQHQHFQQQQYLQQQQQLLLIQQQGGENQFVEDDLPNNCYSDFSEDSDCVLASNGLPPGGLEATARLLANVRANGSNAVAGHRTAGRQMSRYSDSRPLIASSPGGGISADSSVVSLSPLHHNHNYHNANQQQLSPLISGQKTLGGGGFSSASASPLHHLNRFNSLQKAQPQVPVTSSGFSTRTRLAPRHATADGGSPVASAAIPEQVQQQVQIPDLRRIPVTVKSSEYIMAKIQTHMDTHRKNSNHSSSATSSPRSGSALKEREV